MVFKSFVPHRRRHEPDLVEEDTRSLAHESRFAVPHGQKKGVLSTEPSEASNASMFCRSSMING